MRENLKQISRRFSKRSGIRAIKLNLSADTIFSNSYYIRLLAHSSADVIKPSNNSRKLLPGPNIIDLQPKLSSCPKITAFITPYCNPIRIKISDSMSATYRSALRARCSDFFILAAKIYTCFFERFHLVHEPQIQLAHCCPETIQRIKAPSSSTLVLETNATLENPTPKPTTVLKK